MSCKRYQRISGVPVCVCVSVCAFVCLPNYIPEIKRWLIVPINENNDDHWLQTRQSDGSNKTLPPKAMLASSQPQPQLSVASKLLARTMPAIFPSPHLLPAWAPPALRCCVTFLLSAFGSVGAVKTQNSWRVYFLRSANWLSVIFLFLDNESTHRHANNVLVWVYKSKTCNFFYVLRLEAKCGPFI